MKNYLKAFALAGLFAACASDDVLYNPAKQLLPQNIRTIAIRPAKNMTQQFGLEDKLTLRVRDEFLRDGRYGVAPEAQADGVVVITITRYILVPTQFDSVLTPTAYKLRVIVNLDFVDRASNTILWREPNLEGIQSYAAPTVPGGITEEQARELIWDVLARDVATRTISGFGAVSGASQRAITGGDAPTQKPALPPKPILTDPY